MTVLKAAGYQPWLEISKHKKIKWQARDGTIRMFVLWNDRGAGRHHNRTTLRRLIAGDVKIETAHSLYDAVVR
jgi:hypothetical protein